LRDKEVAMFCWLITQNLLVIKSAFQAVADVILLIFLQLQKTSFPTIHIFVFPLCSDSRSMILLRW
jgi:hypothetical protein